MGKVRTWIAEEKLYPLIVLILIWIMAVRITLDSDMWWHLRAGQETWANQAVYRVDTFSFTRAGTPWVNHSWLSQVLMYGILRIGSFPGLSIWVAVCAVLSMGLVYLQMEGHPLLRGAVLLLAGTVSSVVWSPRPQIMSLVLLALVSWLIHSYRKKRRRLYLLLLVPIFALWGNLHAGYVLGLIYLGAVLVGEIFDRVLIRTGEESFSKNELLWVTGAALFSGLAVLINPFGLEIWKIPFNTVSVEALQNLINEWASPDFHQAFQQPLLWMLLGIMAVFGLSEKKVTGRELIPVLIFAWAALTARRNFGPFAIVAAPTLANHLSHALEEWVARARQDWAGFEIFYNKAKSSNSEFNPFARNIINAVMVLLLLTAAVLKTIEINRVDLFKEKEAEIFPAEAVSWLKGIDQPVRLFNDYNWGGYLIYKLPNVAVFVDGRTDLYGDAILNDYLTIAAGKEGWQGLVNEYDLELMLLPKNSSLPVLAASSGWRELYRDDVAVVLAKSKSD